MPEPIVFISHFRVKVGQVDAFRDLAMEVTKRLRAEKPRTVLFLSFLDQAAGTLSFLHAFTDAESMDLHFEGADQRAQTAYQLVEPRGWELYGRPSDAAADALRRAAEGAGVPLTVEPDFIAGFLRLASD
jgi:quinol monooxygenase YgiN